MKRVLLFIMLIITVLFTASCKKSKYEKNEINVVSRFNADSSLTVKCRGVFRTRSNKNQRNYPYILLITDLKLKDLKNKTDGELYSETNNQLTFYKDESFFYIRYSSTNEKGDNYYYINYDYCLIIDEGPYGFNSYCIKTPLPSFLCDLEKTEYDEKQPVFCLNYSKIDYDYKEYLIGYYGKLPYDWVKVNDDSIILTIIDYEKSKTYEVTINLIDEIKISAKELTL